MLSIPERLVRAQLECVTSTCCPDSVQTNYLLVMHVVQGVPQWLKEPALMEDIALDPFPTEGLRRGANREQNFLQLAC